MMNKEEALTILKDINGKNRETIKRISERAVGKAIKLNERIEQFITAIVPEKNGAIEKENLFKPVRELELDVYSIGGKFIKISDLALSFSQKSIEFFSSLELPEEKASELYSKTVRDMIEIQNEIIQRWSREVDELFADLMVGLDKILKQFTAVNADQINDILRDRAN